MKLLFDANVSHKLVQRLSDLFPGSDHVDHLGLGMADDRDLLDYAAEHSYIIVSKDEDLHQMTLLHGPPPKVVWVRLGNCTTAAIERALREGIEHITKFVTDDDGAFLILGTPPGTPVE